MSKVQRSTSADIESSKYAKKFVRPRHETGYPGFLWSTGRRGCIEDGQVNGLDSSQLDLRLRISSYVHIGSWRSSIAAIHLMYEVICPPLKNIEMEFDNRLAKAERCTALHIRYAQYEGTLDVQFFFYNYTRISILSELVYSSTSVSH